MQQEERKNKNTDRPGRKPRVSIVMCTYNGERFLREQLDSLLAQTWPFAELIIQDDCSTDGTCAIVEEYRRNCPDRDIRLFRNAKNLGFERNFLTAVGRTSGDYIAYCDQDDVWREDKVEVLMQHIDGCTMAFCNSVIIDEHGTESRLFYRKPMPVHPDAVSSTLYPVAYGHQMLFCRDVAIMLGRFAQYRISFDYLTYNVAAAMGRIAYVDEPLTCWRRYTGATTYSPDGASASRWSGYAAALRALRNKSNRKVSARYFFLLASTVPFRDRMARRMARLMATGRTFDIFCACLFCAFHPHRAEYRAHGLLAVLRAFFLPLAFIRDHGRYIIRE